MIDKHFRLVIADFNFATRLVPVGGKHGSDAGGLLSDASSTGRFSSTVRRDISVGSVAYNAPELWELE